MAEHWPGVARERGTADVRALARRAVAEAGRHGFTTRVDALRYVNLVVALGERFDERTDCYWAAPILRHRGLSPQAKLDLLTQRAADHLRELG